MPRKRRKILEYRQKCNKERESEEDIDGGPSVVGCLLLRRVKCVY